MNTVAELLRATRVLDLGPLPAPRLNGNAPLQQALQMLVRSRRGAVVVVDASRPVGIFTERDVLYRSAEGALSTPGARQGTRLREVMSQPLHTIPRHASLTEALADMVARQCRHVVVVDDRGELRGLLTTADLIQHLTDRFPQETVHLPPRLRQQYHRPEGA